MEMWSIVSVAALAGFGLRLGWDSADAIAGIVVAVFMALFERMTRSKETHNE